LSNRAHGKKHKNQAYLFVDHPIHHPTCIFITATIIGPKNL